MTFPFLESSRARCFAECLWGRGGTISRRTNRKGAFYFSCSGRGGRNAEGDTLTAEEKEQIEKYVTPDECFVSYRGGNGKVVIWENPFTAYGKRRYGIYSDSVDTKKKIYVFEEDSDWAILEKFTNIRTKSSPKDDYTDEVFQRWYNKEQSAGWA